MDGRAEDMQLVGESQHGASSSDIPNENTADMSENGPTNTYRSIEIDTAGKLIVFNISL